MYMDKYTKPLLERDFIEIKKIPHISIIITAYNAEKTIEQCLKAIKNSDYEDYEIIVIDDGSQDKTSEIAKLYADRIIRKDKNLKLNAARKIGLNSAIGDIIVNIDSDIIIKPDIISRIASYFKNNPRACALTGKLDKNCPFLSYFSQYKNLYMNYIFSKIPEKVSFLYGSIFAIKKDLVYLYRSNAKRADDTEFGQHLSAKNIKINFLKDLEVTHLKQYTFLSWVKNDFFIPFDWGRIFIKYKGWKQLGNRGMGYVHSPKEQLVCVVLAPSIVLMSIVSLFGYSLGFLILILLFVWLLLNMSFIRFLIKEKSIDFGIRSIFVTFFDNIVMATGILSGFISEIFSILTKKEKNERD